MFLFASSGLVGCFFFLTGMFGSGVQSYFVLLRWLFLLNIVILVTTIFFLFIPQMIHNNSIQSNNNTFSGWEFLTGEVRNPHCTSSSACSLLSVSPLILFRKRNQALIICYGKLRLTPFFKLSFLMS